MKKYGAILLGSVLFSCGGTDDQGGEEITSEVDVIADTVQVDTIEEVISEEMTFEFLEDYTQLKTRTEIYEKFGEENLIDESAWYAEGTVELKCSYLTNPDNGDVIKFVFEESNPEELDFVEAHATIYDKEYNVTAKQNIKTKCGTFTGMTLNELREWNEEEFEFSGFGWDYSGGIMAEQGSKINECSIGMTLDYDYQDEDQELYSSLLGDMVFKSDDEKAVRAPIFIGVLSYYLPED